MKNDKSISRAVLLTLLALAAPAPFAASDLSGPGAARLAGLAEARQAEAALVELIRAYEMGNLGLLRQRLDPSMIGYQRLLDGMLVDSQRQLQPRIHLVDLQVQAGPDVAMIQTGWEKRYLNVRDFTPDLQRGQGQFLLHRGTDGWRLAAIGGDNPFASQAGVLARLELLAGADGLVMTVVDADLTGSGRARVSLATVSGTQTLDLVESTPGRFQGMRPWSLVNAPGSSRVVMNYVDANPGNGRPPITLSQAVLTPAVVTPPVTPPPVTPPVTPPVQTLASLRLTLSAGGLNFQVQDADKAGRGSVVATVISASGSRAVTLMETSAGTFTAARGAAELGAISGSVVTLSYLDDTPGNGLLPRSLSQSLVMPFTGVAGQLSLTYTSDAVRFEVYDPDLAAESSLSVTVQAPSGTQTVVLSRIGPGRFQGHRTPLSLGAVSGSSITLRYYDSDPGGPPTTLSRTIIVR